MEDRLFSTVFLGSGLLFLAMLFIGAVNSTSLLAMLAGPRATTFRLQSQQHPDAHLGLCHADGGSVHFRWHSGATHLRPAALGLLRQLSGGADSAAGCWGHKWFQLLFPTWVLLVTL